ncbi:F0F1 ATP synthase subunit A [Gordonia hydrophobica]|uniref:ATP synthase subunit a n=1 Tax=Gordonia hydrophobica TaxID=40516 RepID=A0ABZ2U1G4_9ACTN|nr:F0F1 ATP synthase subunit A [Gordonia hydrophobica]MBM7366586.1 F-type H+-transporting ATPase subunit a [Gordonia hydrophobica]
MESASREAGRDRERERTLSATLAAEFHAPSLKDFYPEMLFGEGTWWGMDRLMLIRVVVAVLVAAFFALALRNPKVVPGKLQNIGESFIDWVRINISEEILGKEAGRKFLPLIASIFFATIMLNLTSIVPFLNISTNARVGFPLVMALVAYITYCWVGIAKFGFFGFIRSSIVLPGVPLPVHFLLVPIEFVSTFILRPFTLTVRLMANMLSGHIMLALFFAATQYFIIDQSGIWTLAGVGSLFAAVGFTFFELLVIALQAYIFALLTAVYIEQSLHADSH